MKRVKRYLNILLCMVLVLSLTACGKSKVATSTDELILAIGTVTLDSESAITAAEQAVAALESKDYDELENLEILDAARKEYDRLFEEDQQRIEAERILNLVTENTWYEIYEGDVYQFNPDGTGDHSGSSINFEINGGMISITEGAAGTETATLNIVETDDSVKLVPEGNSSYYATESDYAVISEGIRAEYTAELTSYEAWTVRNGSAFSMYFMFSEGGTGWAVMYAGTFGLEWEFVDNNTIKIVVWTSSDSSMSAEYDIFNDNGSYSLVQVNNSNVTATPKV